MINDIKKKRMSIPKKVKDDILQKGIVKIIKVNVMFVQLELILLTFMLVILLV
jgi:hypothetical protein